MEKRLIDAANLKDRVMNNRSGSWYDLAQVIAYIDSEPTVIPEVKEEGKKMGYIMLIPAVVFAVILIAIILYILF